MTARSWLATTTNVSDGAHLHASIADGDQEVPVLLVHGWAGTSEPWLSRCDRLLPGRALIAPDLRGHGRSTLGRPSLPALDQCAADIIELLDGLGVARVLAIGHSMGGQLVARLADSHPDRFLGAARNRPCLRRR